MSDLVPVKRALISVSDKTGLATFAAALHNEFRVELISTGGTARFLRERGLPVTDVAEVTGFPEMMDGRIKTLHPLIHGGLLALRDNPEHIAAMKEHGIKPIDLVCINLYPFEQTIAKPGATFEDAIKNIDIGGPAMIRSAAKNHRHVLVVTSPDRYDKVLGDLREHGGSCCGKHRLKQAQRAFARTAEYDELIANYLAGDSNDRIQLNLPQVQELRYGENPHQRAALYSDSGLPFKQLHGKELSYINLLDADAALACVAEFEGPAACIVKHASPCGVATADDLAIAFTRAYDCDPLASFGGIVGLNRTVDLKCANAIVEGQKFLEVIIAPSFAPEALKLLKERWKNVRLVEQQLAQPDRTLRQIAAGYLVQDRDSLGIDEPNWKQTSHRAPAESEISDMKFAWLACKHVKSNAIVIARDRATVGIGGGQVDRVGAARIAIEKAGARAKGAAAASDAFFPFPDGPKLLLDAGITAIIQPGGSVRDQETIDLVNQRGAAMILTGQRHFRH